jgi:hypothetical protein
MFHQYEKRKPENKVDEVSRDLLVYQRKLVLSMCKRVEVPIDALLDVSLAVSAIFHQLTYK